ncbi:MAG: uncharacterized protein KVP18_002870 [Porospora cf. gigantea A]|nr:MAG: hypothetical protein KVP18_002870 [Porospora cf. gigantea A]
MIITKAENCLMGGISWEEQQIRDLALTPCLLVVNLMAYSVTSIGPRKQLGDFGVEEPLSLSNLSERQSLFRQMDTDITRPSTQYHRGRNLILGSCDSYLVSTGSPETSANGTDLSLSLTSSLDVSAS